MSKFYFACYGDGGYEQARNQLAVDANGTGVFDKIYGFGEQSIEPEFYKEHHYILDHKRGYCLWKPLLIHDTLSEMDDGDVLFYLDSADVFIGDPVKMKEVIFKILEDKDILLTSGAFPERQYTKRDAFVGLKCDEEKYWNQIQIENGIIVCKKSENTISFLRKWLYACTNPCLITDDVNILGKENFPEFVEHRWNQSIMSLLRTKYPSGIHVGSEMREFINCNVRDIPGH